MGSHIQGANTRIDAVRKKEVALERKITYQLSGVRRTFRPIRYSYNKLGGRRERKN